MDYTEFQRRRAAALAGEEYTKRIYITGYGWYNNGQGKPWPEVYKVQTIKQARELSGLSQPDFCSKYGLPLGTFRDWEQGRHACPAYVLEHVIFIMVTELETDEQEESNRAYYARADAYEQSLVDKIEQLEQENRQLKKQLEPILQRQAEREDERKYKEDILQIHSRIKLTRS